MVVLFNNWLFDKLNNIIIGSNNITLRKFNIKSYGFENMYMDKELAEDKLYQIIDEFNYIYKITSTFPKKILVQDSNKQI